MFSSLKSLVTTPFSWFSTQPTDDFESEDTPGKRRRVHKPSGPHENDGDQVDTPSAYRVKRIRLDSPLRDDRPTNPAPAPPHAPYLDPPIPSIRPSSRNRLHSNRPARPYAHSNLNVSVPRPDTSRLSVQYVSTRAQAPPVTRTMSMDPPTARRPSVPEPTHLPLPISRDVSMEFSPNPPPHPANPPFRLRAALTPQPGAPLYGPNPQRRERNPSEPPPLTALIENPIFVKPPPQQEQRRVSDGSSPLTLGSLAAQKSGLSANRSHSALVLNAQAASGLRPVNAAEITLQQLEKYRTPLVPARPKPAGSNDGLPELFQTRKQARALVLMQRDKRDDKPRLGHASKYLTAPKEKEKDTPSKNKSSKPYAGEGGLKKLLARRKQEEAEAEPALDLRRQVMEEDDEMEPLPPKRTSKIAEPVRNPGTFARKVSAPPSSAPASRKGGSLRVGRAPHGRSVGPTRTRNRFSAAYDDDEPDGDEPSVVSEEPVQQEKEAVTSSLPKFEPPSGFSFAPPPSVTTIPQAADTSTLDEPPIGALPFTFAKPQPAPVAAPAPVAPPAAPAIALVPPTPERSQVEKPATDSPVPNFFANSQIFSRAGIPPPEPGLEPVSKPEVEIVPASEPAPVAPTVPPSAQTNPVAVVAEPPAPASEPQKPSQPTPPSFFFGSPAPAPPAQSTQPSLPFSLTPSAATPPAEKKEAEVPAQPKSLFGSTSSFGGFGTQAPSVGAVAQPAEPSIPAFSFPKAPTPVPAPVKAAELLKPAFAFAPTQAAAPAPVVAPAAAPASEAPKLPSSAPSPFTFGQLSKAPVAPAPVTPAKSPFTFGATPATPPPATEKPAAPSTGFTFGPSTATPGGASTGFSFGSPAVQTEAKPATSAGGFAFGTPVATPASKSGFTFGTPTPARPVTPPTADDGMRMEESPTRGGGMDINGGSAKPQSLPQLQMPNASKSGFTFGGASTGTGFGSPSPSPFGGNTGTGLTFGQQNPDLSQSTSGGFSFGATAKAAETNGTGFSFGASKPAEPAAPNGFSFGQSTTGSRPSSSSGFAFGQPGPKTAEPTSSGFSFQAPEQIQHSTSFTFGQTAPEAPRPVSSSGFAFGQTQPQQPPPTSGFPFGSSVSNNSFGSAPASPAFGAQTLAPAQPGPFAFGGPTSAPAQPPAPNPFGFGAGAAPPASPAAPQGGFGFGFGAGAPQTPTAAFGASVPQTPTSGGQLFVEGTGKMPPGARPVKRLPTRRGGPAKR
ncbi:hypothetical protein BC834DRAFT_966304 [Gloeopeniophorella convolvens]|nr:hypothetical protein BC834DRAFT_966304 [Gloeopeniophorella convolvens]